MPPIHYSSIISQLLNLYLASCSINSVLCRHHFVSATEMSYVHGWACILLVWPTRVERSPFNRPWHCWPQMF